ncbi:MAG: hypothetical protein O3A01_05095 [bacterium]|nr:hypothetical protein [bacterium]
MPQRKGLTIKKTYFILLQNKYLIVASNKPVKKGNYLAAVRLFETNSTTTCKQVSEWISANHTSAAITEVTDWE